MSILHKIQYRIRVARTVRELSRLSNGVLLDVGVDREDISATVEDLIASRTAGAENI